MLLHRCPCDGHIMGIGICAITANKTIDPGTRRSSNGYWIVRMMSVLKTHANIKIMIPPKNIIMSRKRYLLIGVFIVLLLFICYLGL